MAGSLSSVDYGVVAVFFTVMVGIGVYYSRRPTSSAQFFGNDKTVPWWLSGVSFYMNSFSALAFVMYSALAYKFGWIPVAISWISVPVVLLGAWFLAVRWRRAAKGSPIDFVAERYTPAMCGTLAVLGLPMQLLDNALKLLAIGTVVGVGMGFPLFWAICISGVIIVVYTFLGGLKATLACDFIQFLVIIAVVFALPPLCLGRLAALDGDARKMAYLVAVLLFLGPPLFFFPAMAARVFLPDLPESEMNGVYALLCREVLPVGMMGLVVAAMFAATMSSLAGNFNAAAAVMVNELYLRFSKSPSPRAKMVAARVATVVVGSLVVALTFVMQYAQGADDLFNLSNKVFGVLLPPIALPMLGGLLVRRLSRRAGMSGLIGGAAFGLALFAAGVRWPFLREMIWAFPLTAAATVVFLALGTLAFRDGPAERAAVEAFFSRLEKENDKT